MGSPSPQHTPPPPQPASPEKNPSGKNPSSPLSPDAEPFFPEARSAGRSKACRWEIDSAASDSDYDLGSPEAPSASYLDVACRGLTRTEAPPEQTDSRGPPMADAGHCSGTKTQRRRRRRVRTAARRAADFRSIRGPAHQRLGKRVASRSPAHSRRLPVHQRLGPQRRASAPDADGWQKVLHRDEGRPAPRPVRPQAPRQPIPPEYAGRCLNCLSSTHRIASCRLPRRCTRCRSSTHLAKDCKRSREEGPEPNNQHRFVRQRHGDSTPEGSNAGGDTPERGPHQRRPAPAEETDAFTDTSTPGHPATRPREAECYIQRDESIDAAEAALRLALVAQPSGATTIRSTSAVLQAIVATTGISTNDIRVKLFYPQHFIILCSSPAIKDRVAAASPVPFGTTPLVLISWTRVANADLHTLKYKLSIELEGIPPHVWREETAAKMLAPYCWIQEIAPATAVHDDLSAFRLTAWTKSPASLPQLIWLNVAEHEVPPPEADPTYRPVNPLRSYPVIVHLRWVQDFSAGPAPRDDDDDSPTRGARGHPGSGRGSGADTFPYRCRRGALDGQGAGGQNGTGNHQPGNFGRPRQRIATHLRLGPHGAARVPAWQRLGTPAPEPQLAGGHGVGGQASGGGNSTATSAAGGPRERIGAHQRLGPNGAARIPACQRLDTNLPGSRHGDQQSKSKRGKRKIWRPKMPTSSQAEQAVLDSSTVQTDPVSAKEAAGTSQPLVLEEQTAAPGGQQATGASQDKTAKASTQPPTMEESTAAPGGQGATEANQDNTAAGKTVIAEPPNPPQITDAEEVDADAEETVIAPSPRPCSPALTATAESLALCQLVFDADFVPAHSQTTTVLRMDPRWAADPMLLELAEHRSTAQDPVSEEPEGSPAKTTVNGPILPAHEEESPRPAKQQCVAGSEVLPDDQQSTATWTPAPQQRVQRTPSTPRNSASADRRFKGFAFKVKRPRASPLLKLPSPPKGSPTTRTCMPLRSRRIAAQSISRIPAAKRGEYLVLKRLGHATEAEPSAVGKNFDDLFGGKPEDSEALRELFHEDRAVGARKRPRNRPRKTRA